MKAKTIVALIYLSFVSFYSMADLEAGLEAHRQNDYETALRNFAPLAEQGDAQAQLAIGYMFMRGQGLPKDIAQAISWLRRSAAQGNKAAADELTTALRMAQPQGKPYSQYRSPVQNTTTNVDNQLQNQPKRETWQPASPTASQMQQLATKNKERPAATKDDAKQALSNAKIAIGTALNNTSGICSKLANSKIPAYQDAERRFNNAYSESWYQPVVIQAEGITNMLRSQNCLN